jgi:OOP family OmpA-OmpF porin
MPAGRLAKFALTTAPLMERSNLPHYQGGGGMAGVGVKFEFGVGLTVVALLAATNAIAQTSQTFRNSPRWYAEIGAGFHWPSTVYSHSLLPAPDGKPYDWVWRTQPSVAVVANIGYRITPHWRVEIDSGFYNSPLQSIHAPGPDDGGVSATRPGEPYGLCARNSVLPNCISLAHSHPNVTFEWSGFANAIYDILPNRRFDPFIGAGAGMEHIEWSGVAENYVFSKVTGPSAAGYPDQILKGAGTLFRPDQFAIQFLGGVSYRISRRLRLDTTYYYYFAPGLLRWNPENNTPGLPVGAGLRPGDFLGRFHDQSVIVSLRYAF